MNSQIKEAARCIAVAQDPAAAGMSATQAAQCARMEAQTHAILAVAEQLRIANLLAITRADPADAPTNTSMPDDAFKALAEWVDHDDPECGGYPEWRPEVAEALGIEQP
jgi:hypothetical protein